MGTIPSPLRAFLRIRLNAASRRGSMVVSVFLAFSRIFSSCAFVSETISSSSFFLCSRSLVFSFSNSLAAAICSLIATTCCSNSRICFSDSSISSVSNSISFERWSYSLLLRTLSSCLVYRSIFALLVSILPFCSLMFSSSCLSSNSKLLIRVPNPAISSSRSATSRGSSPLRVLMRSISER